MRRNTIMTTDKRARCRKGRSHHPESAPSCIIIGSYYYLMPCISLLSLGDSSNTKRPVPIAIQPNTEYTSMYLFNDSGPVAAIPASTAPPAPVSFASCPARKLDPEKERNQAPISVPVNRSGASLVTIDRPMGEMNSSPTV